MTKSGALVSNPTRTLLKRNLSFTSRKQQHSHDNHHPAPTATTTTTIPADVDLKLFDNGFETPNKTQVQIMGNPPNMCKIKLPPSLPLYIKRNHLVSIFNIANLSKSVSLQNQWVHPWKNLLLWPNALPIYHKIITNPALSAKDTTGKQHFVDLLVSSKYNNCLTSLNLNGSKDWFIWGNFAKNIIAFEDNSSLTVQPEFKWSFGNSNFWKHLQSAQKLFKKYIHLSGRGITVLQSETGSSIYSINLKDNKDEVMIRLDNLLGCSGSNYTELISNMSPYLFTSTPEKSVSTETPSKEPKLKAGRNWNWNLPRFWERSNKKIEVTNNSVAVEPVVNEFSAKEFFSISKNILHKIISTVRYYYHQFINGNLSLSKNVLGKGLFSANYVTIRGPRTVLIQSNSIKSEILDKLMAPQKTSPPNVFKPVSPFDLNEAASKQKNLSQQMQESINNKNHLSYAYVDTQKNKVVFQSTPDFNASIEESVSKK
ncbi:hypothetical protein ACO0RG_004441 [Hanseniaspora osmophila]